MSRIPTTFAFTDGQALMMRTAIFKLDNIGYTVRGDHSRRLAEELYAAGLVTLEPVDDVRGRGYTVRPTKAGREAWHNLGLRAAGRLPVCLP